MKHLDDYLDQLVVLFPELTRNQISKIINLGFYYLTKILFMDFHITYTGTNNKGFYFFTYPEKMTSLRAWRRKRARRTGRAIKATETSIENYGSR